MTREHFMRLVEEALEEIPPRFRAEIKNVAVVVEDEPPAHVLEEMEVCLLYTSPSPRDRTRSRMPSSA